jgi:hypothetical protein
MQILMMMLVLVMTKVLLRILIKGFLTAHGAEVICLSFVFRGTRGGCGVNIHVANRIMYSCWHMILSFRLSGYYMNQMPSESTKLLMSRYTILPIWNRIQLHSLQYSYSST